MKSFEKELMGNNSNSSQCFMEYMIFTRIHYVSFKHKTLQQNRFHQEKERVILRTESCWDYHSSFLSNIQCKDKGAVLPDSAREIIKQPAL